MQHPILTVRKAPCFGFGEVGERTLKEKFLPAVRETAGATLDPEEFHVRGMLLCNSRRDRYYSRFTPDALNEVVDLLPGRPVMIGHNRTTLPIGRFFSAKRTFGRANEPMHETRGPRADRYWVEGLFYLPKDAEGDAIARRIDMGIYRDTSIGWRCTDATCSLCGNNIDNRSACHHVPGELYDDGFADFAFSGITSVMEGSLVFSGGQIDTTTFNPEARSRSGSVSDFELEDLFGGALMWDRIAPMKSVFAEEQERGKTERSRRLRSQVGAIICSKDRFEQRKDAASFVREHEFRADKPLEDSDNSWRFVQREGTTERGIKFDEGVTAALLTHAPEPEVGIDSLFG